MSASETAAAPISSAQPPHSSAHVAVVVPALRESGGVATVGRFIHRVLDESDAYDPAFISVPLSSRDPASLRHLDPETWPRGAVIEEEMWRDTTFNTSVPWEPNWSLAVSIPSALNDPSQPV
jgi:hypothetical protein